ncbi:MAG: oligosaccharide flippase family protein [Candidatus Pacebacteria bacterium]|nr:oligosaccharide flippase family protein [Candidatus Paceibacterota bacterium]MBP9840718.1 oligosaccharide flippase family protein [Candidatus Paceibacterota bacterium]
MMRAKAAVYAFLRWSERFTRTDMVYLAGGGFWLGLGYAFQLASGIAIAILLANWLPREAYGTYQFIISMSAILSGLTLTGIGTALMRAVARGAKGALPYAFRLQLVWGFGIVIASFGVALYYFINGNIELASAFLIVGACAPLLGAFSLYRPYLEGRKLFRDSTLLGAWRRPVPLIAIAAALYLTDDPILLVLVYFVSHTLSMGLLYLSTVRKYAEPKEEHPEILSYGKHLSVMSIVGLVANNLDNVLVFHYLGAAPLAIYALAQLPLIHTLKTFGLGGSLVFPKYATRTWHEIREGIGSKLALYSFATGIAVVAYIALAPFIFNAVFPAYPEAVIVSQVLILAVLAKPFTLYAQAFAAHGMKKIQHFVQISVSLLKLVLLFILLPIFGLWGAAAAILISTLYWCIILLILFYSHKEQTTVSVQG